MSVTRRMVPDVWPNYSSEQRRFDSVHNEWDLAFDLGSPDDDSDDEDNGDDINISGTLSNTHLEIELSTAYRNVSMPGIDVEVADPPLEEILLSRYGFYPSVGHVVDQKNTQYRLSGVKVVFGHREALVNRSRDELAIKEFYHALMCDRPIPRQLCDLFPEHEQSLSDYLHLSNAVVMVRVVSQEKYYVVEPRHPPPTDVEWQVVLDNPLTALQCCRENWATSRLDLAKTLFERGIPLRTRARQPLLIPAPVFSRVGLGYRPENHIPDRYDYMEYEGQLLAFLRKPHARAALLRGGAHLASGKRGSRRVQYRVCSFRPFRVRLSVWRWLSPPSRYGNGLGQYPH
jgi:hypothetical protein